MNGTHSLVVDLKELLPEPTWSWVIAALRQDALVWESLQENERRAQAISIIGDRPDAWSPIVLALINLDYPDPVDINELDEKLRQQAVRTYQSLLEDEPSGLPDKLTLAHEGLLAIALYDRRQKAGSWSGLTEDLFDSHLTDWYTPLACLLGLSDDRIELLRALIYPNAPRINFRRAIHAIISNPIPPSRQIEIIKEILHDLPINDLAVFLRILQNLNPALASTLALSTLHDEPTIPNKQNVRNFAEEIDQIVQLISQAELNFIGGQTSQSASLQTMASQVSRHLQIEIADQISEAIARNGKIDDALRTWKQLRPYSNGYGSTIESYPPPGLILAMLEANQPADALALYPSIDEGQESADDVAHLIALAHLAKSQGNFDKACKNARQALEILEAQDRSFMTSGEEHLRLTTSTAAGLSCHLMRLFADLGLSNEAIKVAQLAVSLQPNNPDLYASLANLYRIARKLLAAVESAQIAVTLSPHRTDLRFNLVDYLEMNGDWPEALKERTQLLDKRFTPSPDSPWPEYDHYYALATCALNAGNPQRAADICQQILRENPTDGLAHAAYGEALEELGDTQAAFDHFQQATQFTPYQSTPWLALAHAHQRAGNLDKAIDTLRSATHAVANDPLVHLELAEIYLKQNVPTQALNSLRQAHQISNEHPAVPSVQKSIEGISREPGYLAHQDQSALIALRLGETLHELGHLSEARDILAAAYQTNPAYPGLAHAYAKSLLDLKEPVASIPPLVVAVQAQPDDPSPHLDYAFALLETGDHPEDALKAARQALSLSPNNPLGQAYLAEALAANGEMLSALQSYFNVFDSDLIKDPFWHNRLAIGLGRTALALDKPEVALAILQESAVLDPKNSDIQCLIAEAYIKLQLPREALAAAQNAIQLAPDDIETLSWFAKYALLLDARTQALKALNRAVQLKPTDTSLLVQLGTLQIQVGENQAARDAFHQVLDSDYASKEDLTKTAQGLQSLNDASGSIACLERALNLQADPDESILHDLAIAYMYAGEHESALETIDRAISLNPEDSALHIAKADLLLNQDRPEAAHAALEHALQDNPCDINLHHRLALILRSNGDLIEALSHAEQMVSYCIQTSAISDEFLARAFAADIARTLQQPGKARKFLIDGLSGEQDNDDAVALEVSAELKDTSALLYYALSAELALDEGEEIAAAEALTKSIGIDPNQPRIIALQARLTQLRGDISTALETFDTGLEKYEADAGVLIIGQSADSEETDASAIHQDNSTSSLIALYGRIQDLNALASAAVDLYKWDEAINLLRRAIDLAPSEPYSHLQLARTLVLRGEYQHLCETADAVTHAPGPDSLIQPTYQLFAECLQNASEHLPIFQQSDQNNLPLAIKRWKARGEAVFHPNSENLHALDMIASQPDDFAARIAAARQLNNINETTQAIDSDLSRTNLYTYNAKVLIQQALSLGYSGRRQEDMLEAKNKTKSAVDKEPKQPLYHVLYADIAYQTGDYSNAIKSLQTALSFWSDEPRWHNRIAQLHLETGDPMSAITHLKQAVELEQENISHHLHLAKALMQACDFDQALQILEGAQRLAPRHFEIYMALGKVYLAKGDLAKAALHVENAISLEPEKIDPLLLRSEVALKAADPRGAYQRAQAALKIKPNDPEALRYLARALDGLERYSDALFTVEQAIKNSSDPLPLLVERVDLLEKSKGSQAAFAALQDLAEEYPDEPAILAPLANALAAAGQREAAIHAAQRALHGQNNSLDPEVQGHAHYLLGSLLRQSGQLDQAIHHLSEAIQLITEDLKPYLELGSAYQERRQYDLALNTYHQAISIAPKDARAYYQSGLVLKEMRDYQASEDMLRRAADLAPEDLTIHRQLGAIVALNLVHNRRPASINISS